MPERKISVAEPVTELRRIPIRECGEGLVDFTEVCPGLVLASSVFEYRRATLVRETVAQMLCRALEVLPNEYRLGILEGWRPAYIQRRMWLTSWMRFKKLHPEWSDVKLRRVTNRYVAPLNSRVPPPHSTGGAIDVFLVDESGQRLDHSSPFKMFDPRGYAFDAPGLSDAARRHRDILAKALLTGGLTNYPSEWWHWSYGDQGWAYRGGHETALYGQIDRPAGWEPVAVDDVHEPLLRLIGTEPESGFPRVMGRNETRETRNE